VTVLPAGDAGAALNKAILSKDAPLADLLFGVDNTFLSRALAAGIFEPYQSPALASIPERFRLDPSAQLLPVDYGYVSINYDKAYLQKNGLTPPTSLRDLTKPEWKGLLVVENPATSSPGLGFVLATIAEFGTDGAYSYLDFWRDLRANDVLVVEGWTEAYSTQFSAASGKGPRPLVVSYATSPAAEVFFSDGKLSEPPTGNLNAGSFLQIEFIGILKGTKQRALAERFVDYLLSKRFQEDIPLQMFVYPVLPNAALPDVFTKFAPVPDAIANITAQQIGQNREAWIEAWTKVVLR
jgi:thiamine transport system substrate-binding protein